MTIKQIAEDYVELKKLMLESDKTRKLVEEATVIIRREVLQHS